MNAPRNRLKKTFIRFNTVLQSQARPFFNLNKTVNKFRNRKCKNILSDLITLPSRTLKINHYASRRASPGVRIIALPPLAHLLSDYFPWTLILVRYRHALILFQNYCKLTNCAPASKLIDGVSHLKKMEAFMKRLCRLPRNFSSRPFNEFLKFSLSGLYFFRQSYF